MNKIDVLKILAATMNIEKTLVLCPKLSMDDLRGIIQEASQLFAEDNHQNLKELKLFIDGASRGNPGKAGIGVIIKDEKDKVILKKKQYLGTSTNNVAEYMALLVAIEEARRLDVKQIKIFSDSQLLVKQVKGEYRVRKDHLRRLFQKAIAMLKTFDKYDILYIKRENNKEADSLANKAIDDATP